MMVVPFSAAWHGRFVQAAADSCGLGWDVRCDSGHQLVTESLALANNDACYDTLIAVAQALRGVREAVDAGVNPDDITVGVPITCNQCRSADKPFFIKRALAGAGFGRVKITSLFDYMAKSNDVSDYAQRRIAASIVIGDALLQMRVRMRPFSKEEEGACFDAAMDAWRCRALQEIASRDEFDVVPYIEGIEHEAMRQFAFRDEKKPKVGIAGSVTAIFNEDANGGVTSVLKAERCEVYIPYLASVISFALFNQGLVLPLGQELERICSNLGEDPANAVVAPGIREIRRLGTRYVPDHVCRGLGWSVVGWIVQLLESGVENVVYSSLFGCLSGHVSGTGVLGAIRKDYPNANIVAVEYDPGTSIMNQVNRLRLMASVAWQRLEGAQNES